MNQIPLSDSEFRGFQTLIYKLCGISLGEGKRQLVQSRLQSRLRHHNFTRFAEYHELLMRQGANSAEFTLLVNCITTNKTDFFRESHHFDFITRHVLPELSERARRGEQSRRLRVWHAGCSTGEEPYTLAMTLKEAMQGESGWDVLSLASDIDTNVLAHAEKGEYAPDRVETIPETLRRKYMQRSGAGEGDIYCVRQDIRDMIRFRHINLLAEAWPIRPDVRFDALFCRNVIIYFDKPTQRKLFARFAERIRPGGYLFIGHSESLFGISDAFTPLGNTIFQLPPDAGVRRQAA